MANTPNIMSIAPNQPASSTRTTSQSTQPKYKSAARQGKKNFGATLDKINAKIDELKQNIQDLQDSTKKISQVEPDAKDLDAAEEISAQGTSDTPQDAPQEAIGNEELGIMNDSEPIAEDEIQPADIFFVADKSVDTIEVADAQKPIENIQPEESKPSVEVKPVVAEIVKPIEVDAPKTQPTEKISPDNLRGVEVQDTLATSADKVDDQPQKTFFAANNAAYLFNMNAETLLAPKSVEIQPQIDVPKVEGVQEVLPAQNLMTIMPQTKSDNSQSMLHMLSGKSWRVIEPQVQVQTTQPTLQAQPAEIPLQTQIQPTVQAQHVEIPLQAQVQPTLQAQPVEIPLQAQVQPTVQAQPVEIPLKSQVQPTVQAQHVEIQPQTQIQPTVQAQPVELPLQTQIQPTLQAQPVEIPVQAQVQAQVQIQPKVQAQPINFEPQVQIQTTQPTLQPQPTEIPLQAQVQPTVQAQSVEIPLQTPIQPTVQAQPIEIPLQTPIQPTLQAQPVEIPLQTQIQPTLQAQSVEIPVQTQIQPTVQAQSVEIPLQTQVQPTLQAQPVEIPLQTQIQPTVQAQPINFEPQVQIQTTQPTLQPQPTEIQPQVQVQAQVQIQPTVQAQPINFEPQVQVQTTQPTLQPQPIEIQPTLQAQPVVQAEIQAAQPVVQQKLDAQPTIQNLSELLGVNVQVEDAPIAAPVSAPQPPTQQFNQDTQQGAQNFQQQIFQPVTTDEPQQQQVSTGGEIFAANLSAKVDSPQPQPSTPVQAPDLPPPTQDQFDVQGQIVRQARLIRTTENTQMVIKLNPEHLGELTLRISVSQNGAVNASFHSDNAQVRTIIENSLVQLRQELNNQGLKVENVQVYAGLSDGGLMNGQGGQAWQQNRQQRQGNRRIDFDSLENDIDSTAPINENASADGVDYSV